MAVRPAHLCPLSTGPSVKKLRQDALLQDQEIDQLQFHFSIWPSSLENDYVNNCVSEYSNISSSPSNVEESQMNHPPSSQIYQNWLNGRITPIKDTFQTYGGITPIKDTFTKQGGIRPIKDTL